MDVCDRKKLEFLMRALIGLELFATGELDATKTPELEDFYLALRARTLVYEVLLYGDTKDDDQCDDTFPGDAGDSPEGTSTTRAG